MGMGPAKERGKQAKIAWFDLNSARDEMPSAQWFSNNAERKMFAPERCMA
jgi:hypothetical protein